LFKPPACEDFYKVEIARTSKYKSLTVKVCSYLVVRGEIRAMHGYRIAK
jgi:hypothetical protein